MTDKAANMAHDFLPYSIFAADIQNYSARDALGQVELRQQFRELMREAASAAHLDPVEWRRQDSGDGELALIPPSIPKVRLADDLVRELKIKLQRINHPRRAEERIRLRVALHHGDVCVDGTGFPGPAVVVASRLLDAEPLRQALDAVPDAFLAIILSDRMFEDVEGQRDILRPDFRAVTVVRKRFEGRAWVKVPGFPPPDLTVAAPSGSTSAGTPDDGAPSGQSDPTAAGDPGGGSGVSLANSPVHGSPLIVGRDQRAGRDINNR